MIWLAVLAGVYILSLMLKLHWITALIVGAFLLLRLPKHRRLYRMKKSGELRFGEVSEYLDTLLYAFMKEEKVERALVDAEAALVDGNMRAVLQKAVDHLHMTFDDTDVMRDSLRMIEAEYPCRRIRSVHEFLVHVETYGGAVEKPAELLLADKSRWEKRLRLAMKDRRKMFADIVMSIAASLVICGMILYLPVMDMDISGNVISQVLSIVVIMLDDAVFTRAQSYLAVDWLTLEWQEDAGDAKKMEDYHHYNVRRDRRLSFVLGALSIGVTVLALWFGRQAAAAAGMVLTLVLLNQHKIGRALAGRSLVRSIKCAFPEWLLDIVLLLQSENVQVALQKSQEHVPPVLEKELESLVGKLEMEPESVRPYHAFLKEFQIPEVHSAMSMLFSLSMGNSRRADRQIGELIERNMQMLDAAEKERLKNAGSGMYLLFLAPVLTASLKLVVDMAVFMLTFLAGTGIG